MTTSTVGLRNSVLPEVSLSFSASAWQEFLAGVTLGEFDRPLPADSRA
jgi:hypothetical protein